MAGPGIVVIASLASAWIAIRSNDGLVEQDYYKQGLLINRVLRAAPIDPLARLGAVVDVERDGHVRVRLEGAPAAPEVLRLTLGRPASGAKAEVVTLTRGEDGEYRGTFGGSAPGRWIVTLEANGWRLPTTTVLDRLEGIRLGAAAPS
jgi:hypothetical protein